MTILDGHAIAIEVKEGVLKSTVYRKVSLPTIAEAQLADR